MSVASWYFVLLDSFSKRPASLATTPQEVYLMRALLASCRLASTSPSIKLNISFTVPSIPDGSIPNRCGLGQVWFHDDRLCLFGGCCATTLSMHMSKRKGNGGGSSMSRAMPSREKKAQFHLCIGVHRQICTICPNTLFRCRAMFQKGKLSPKSNIENPTRLS